MRAQASGPAVVDIVQRARRPPGMHVHARLDGRSTLLRGRDDVNLPPQAREILRQATPPQSANGAVGRKVVRDHDQSTTQIARAPRPDRHAQPGPLVDPVATPSMILRA